MLEISPPLAPCHAGKKSIDMAVRPRKGSTSVCSRRHLPAPGYEQLAERRFEFISPVGVSRVRAYRVLELAQYHSLGKLSEPESIRGFF
jgi:hypothetical protein